MADEATVSIPLTQGMSAQVDAADAALVSGFKWQAAHHNGRWYTQAAVPGRRGPISMHRLLMGPGKGLMVDHVNGDGLDNRRSNMRVCTHTENMWNQRVQQTERKISRFKGVTWKARGKPWGAAIQQNGARLFIGSYRTEEEAARAYDAAAKVFHGRFACTNAGMGLFDQAVAA